MDAIASSEELLETAKKLALEIAAGRKPWLQTLRRTDRLESLADAREILGFARQQARQTAPNLKHPLACLDAVEAGVLEGGYRGNLKVNNSSLSLLLSLNASACEYLFDFCAGGGDIPQSCPVRHLEISHSHFLLPKKF